MGLAASVKHLAKAIAPAPLYEWAARHGRRWPPLRRLRLGTMRRLTPVSSKFGLDRGTAVDRYYIEQFLERHRADIRGRVLEVGDDSYTRRFGNGLVARSDVLHAHEGNHRATIVGDLSTQTHFPSDAFDCIIFTQTLSFIFDTRPAIRTLHRMLRPGGVLLVTLPGLTQISRYDMERWGDFWRFTSLSAQRLFAEAFSSEVTVEAHGNVWIATALLQGLTVEELLPKELNYVDPDYQVLITVRAVKR
jgi:SAM-dependent methyltransferase